MNTFNKMNPDEFELSPFKLIGKEWMLITAVKDGKVNTMTASWGGLGVMWGTNATFSVIRQSRYTKELIDESDYYSLSFLDHKQYSKELGYLGSVSGRDENKIEKANLNVSYSQGVPYIDEASKVIICKKLFCQKLETDNFIVKELEQKWYKDKDYHDLYVGEIIDILVR